MRATKWVVLLLLSACLAACGLIKRAPPPPTYAQLHGVVMVTAPVRLVHTPDVGQKATVAVGASMVAQTRQSQNDALELVEAFERKLVYDKDYDFVLSVPAGLFELVAVDQARARYFKVHEPRLKWLYRGSFAYDEPILAELRLSADGKWALVWRFVDRPPEVVELASIEARHTVTPPRLADVTFRRELIYTGRAGSTLTLLYREFSGDMARPAFSQTLQYDISSDQVIGYQGARFRVLSADNTGITYEVLAHMAQ